MKTELLRALSQVKAGADVFDYGLAVRLREVERTHPDLIEIGECMGSYDGAGELPYFGAIATAAGRALIDGGAV